MTPDKHPMKPPAPSPGSLTASIEQMAAHFSPTLTFARQKGKSFDVWRRNARDKINSLLQYDVPRVPLRAQVVGRWESRDFIQEKVLLSTTPWFQVPAYVLTPKGPRRRRPAIVDLHSHGGMYLYGKEKVMPMPEGESPAVARYRRDLYGGRSTSLELCRRGYVVISIDNFYFGERRALSAEDRRRHGTDPSRYSPALVRRFNREAWAGESELARQLCLAGTTWPGISHWDDRRTIDYLVTRPDVDPERIGCVGVSMGGYRSAFLGAQDKRIRTAVVAGWMSTLRPMIEHHAVRHSFVQYVPGLTQFLDLPDAATCLAPKPLLVLQCTRDELFPLAGMKDAVKKIASIYRHIGAPQAFHGVFFDKPHTFDVEMQEQAFAWLDRTLQPGIISHGNRRPKS
jgi:dienelactone hydrolase